MDERLKWLTPAALLLASSGYSYATTYLSLTDAQKSCFPNADQFVANNIIFTPAQIRAIEAGSGQKVLTRGQQVWKAMRNGRSQGYFILDYVIGKHLAIDYAVALTPTGEVRQIEILTYRETYGGEIRNADWRKQFVGKTARSPLSLNNDIRNISGATLSSRHVTEGVKRLLSTYEVCLKKIG
jgi:Na+-translocating ferredoxin:NAD+ oxidoreductase RnfG subunit